ncbi:MAG TPA: M28 family peptidase [Candidatus Tumulicola sp.]
MMTRRVLAIAAVLAIAPAAAPAGDAQIEADYLQIPTAAGASASSRVLDSVMHYAGTPGDYRMAVYMRDTMRKYGLKATIESFSATVYTPRILQLQLLASPVVTFDLHDEKIAADPDGSRPDAGLPFNAGSGNGDIRARAVYVSRGLETDYQTLARAGVVVKGRIAIVRYGAEYRGNLASRAAAHGAAGVIFYSDPKDDGYGKGRVYPNGPYRPMGVVQRGTVSKESEALPIPVLPVTAYTAAKLLANSTGVFGPPGWAGDLHLRYTVGTTSNPVHLHVEMNARRTTLWNTIGELTGSNPSQIVILGGHRDAWVYGVTDDGSGISTLLEVARGLGHLAANGWTPKRTIRIAGWDAEEIGELGSSAYVAAHLDELRAGCVAYLNTDEAASGPTFGVAAAGALNAVVGSTVTQVLHINNPEIDAPAGGSDFESFVYKLGTPVVDMGFSGPLGTYHSPYDDYRYASLYADPGFVHHRAIAQTIGLMAIRLADAPGSSYRFAPYVASLRDGRKTMDRDAARATLTVGTGLSDAIERFASAAQAYDVAGRVGAQALQAAQRLDLVAYSANGYASVAFPAIAKAIATKSQANVDAAVQATSQELDAITDLLTPAR